MYKNWQKVNRFLRMYYIRIFIDGAFAPPYMFITFNGIARNVLMNIGQYETRSFLIDISMTLDRIGQLLHATVTEATQAQFVTEFKCKLAIDQGKWPIPIYRQISFSKSN